MITEMNSLLTAMKSHLSADTDLSYIENVFVRKYAQPGDLPDFDKWAVVISPEEESHHLIANRAMQIEDNVSVVCCVRNWSGGESPLIGTTAGAIGIIKMVADVRASLVQFGDDHPTELLVLYDEMEQPVRFNTHKFPERQDFFHEVILPYRVRMQETTF